jgi:hypothetical protein
MPQRVLKDILSKYNLQEIEGQLKDITVPKGTKMFLTNRPRSEYRENAVQGVYRTLKPKSLTEVKKWIGIPDEVARKRRILNVEGPVGPAAWRTARTLETVALPSPEKFEMAKANAPQRRMLKEVARNFVYGDSKTLVPAELAMAEQVLIGAVLVAVASKNIVIEHDAQLVVQPDVWVLAANAIKIYQGGQLIANGTLMVDCVSMQGNIPP